MTDNTNANSLGLLAALLLRPEIKGTWFHNKEVKLDGYRFVSCRFDNCRLTVTSTNFELDICYIDNNTVVVYGNEIAKPIRLFNCRYDWVYKNMPFFAPVRHEDGTISIKA